MVATNCYYGWCIFRVIARYFNHIALTHACMDTGSLNACEYIIILSECMAVWSKPNEPSIQHHVHILYTINAIM